MSSTRLLRGRYEIGAVIGHGGMAEVHAGVDTRLGRPVAVKMLRADLARDQHFLTRFRREAQAAASMTHPNIVAIYDSGEEDLPDGHGGVVKTPYIVMEYVAGRTLREVIQQDGPLPAQDAAPVMEQVLAALGYSHRAGVVHRDVKPANVMLTPEGVVKVMDFGIARAIADTQATMTQTSAVIGTAQYLSPEQARGQNVDERSDIYSAGCMLFELLTARTPFVGDSPVAIAYQHVREEPTAPSTLVPSVPHEYDAITLHAMTKDREERYQSAEAMRGDLLAADAGEPISAEALGTAAVAEALRSPGAGLGETGTMSRSDIAAAGLSGAAVRGMADPRSPDGFGSSDDSGAMGGLDDPGTRSGRRERRSRRDGGDALDGRGGRAGKGRRRLGALLGVLLALALIGGALFVGARGLLGSRGPSTVAVPSVAGTPEAAARAAVSGAGFQVKEVQAANLTVPSGTVISQSPSGGAQAVPGTSVELSVSSGPTEVPVPNVTGADQAQALATLNLAGFQTVNPVTVDDPSQPLGKVVSTDPAAGTTVLVTQAVTLKVSSGKVPVPTVTGKDQTSATVALSQAHLTPTIQQVIDGSVTDGTVTAQSVAGGTVIDVGSPVTITVARKPPSVTVSTVTATATVTATTTAGPSPAPPPASTPPASTAPPASTPPGPTNPATGTPKP